MPRSGIEPDSLDFQSNAMTSLAHEAEFYFVSGRAIYQKQNFYKHNLLIVY